MFKRLNLQLRTWGAPMGLASMLFLPGLANAQIEATEEEGQSNPAIEEVIVTGSRIARSGYDSPTPTTTLGQEAISSQAPVEIGEVVNELPSMAGSTTATRSQGSIATGNAGVSALNLRDLGVSRTLVLLDGRRSSVSTSSGQTDLSTMPQGLIERVEVVTGGASAAYGSGAVGGVVNFILDTDYTGVKTSLQYGETAYSDHRNYKFGLTAGTEFSDGRGHLLFDGELSDVNGIHPDSNVVRQIPARDWLSHGRYMMANPDLTPGAPAFIIDDHVGKATHTPGGLIDSGPLMGTSFGVNGTINQFAYGDVRGQFMRGGDWQDAQANTASLASDEARHSIFTRGSFALTPNVEIFGEASYAKYKGLSHYLRVETLRIPIQRDNAFLPTEIGAAMDEAGIDSFFMSTTNADSKISGDNFSRETVRYVAGATGVFTAFDNPVDWDFYYAKSITDAHQLYLPGIYHLARMTMATDAVVDPVSGEIVCRSTLAEPGNGCVPLNRFGIGVSSPEAWDYMTGQPLRDEKFELDVVAIDLRPGQLPGWAGPITVALGAEWRREGISGEVEEQYKQGWRFSNFQEDVGSYDLLEGYVEALIPITQNLEFNGAFRVSDYSTTGGITTWKSGLTYSPFESMTVRMTGSRDIRAPNLGELFATGTARGNTIEIDGVVVAFQQKLQGSTDTKAEEATSYNIGLVFQPHVLPGFRASVDYYDIEVDGVIAAINVENTVRMCYDLNIQEYCNNLHFTDPSDRTTLTTVDLYYRNLDRMSVKGVDLEASYQFSAADLFGRGSGYINLRALASHFIEHVLDNGEVVQDSAGSNLSSTPDWKYRLAASYALDPWRFDLTARGVSDGVLSKDYIECRSNCPVSRFPNYTVMDNSTDGQLVFDASLTRSFTFGGTDWDFFLAVQNLLNTDPPIVDSPAGVGAADATSYPPTNRNLYDFLGRRFRLGVRVDFGG